MRKKLLECVRLGIIVYRCVKNFPKPFWIRYNAVVKPRSLTRAQCCRISKERKILKGKRTIIIHKPQDNRGVCVLQKFKETRFKLTVQSNRNYWQRERKQKLEIKIQYFIPVSQTKEGITQTHKNSRDNPESKNFSLSSLKQIYLC